MIDGRSPLSEAAGSWWGTGRMLPIAAQQAGAPGGAPWQETIITVAHVAGALALLGRAGTRVAA